MYRSRRAGQGSVTYQRDAPARAGAPNQQKSEQKEAKEAKGEGGRSMIDVSSPASIFAFLAAFCSICRFDQGGIVNRRNQRKRSRIGARSPAFFVISVASCSYLLPYFVIAFRRRRRRSFRDRFFFVDKPSVWGVILISVTGASLPWS